MINTVKERVVVENWGSKIKYLDTSCRPLDLSLDVEPLDPVHVGKLKVAVSVSKLATLDEGHQTIS